ncbi:MAG: alpha/beta hydrolase, partial [Anaerolineales bacterium]|nr:alpha/beta hydrolase [Anaerolineales bacterium]
MSLQARIAKIFLAVQYRNWNEGSVEQQRRRQKKNSRFMRMPGDVRCTPVNPMGIPAEWIQVPGAGPGVILYLHGGAYALGSLDTHREFVARLARVTQRRALAIAYRLAPEHPFPAALEDARTAYEWLLQEGYAPADIVMAGDSAGGGLALACMIAQREAGQPLPAGAVLMSPWLDLAHTGASFNTKAAIDPILTREGSKMYAHWYAGENDLANPLISPLYADLSGLPPLLIQASADEILLDDSTRLAERARQAGVETALEIYEGVFHVFQIVPFLPESREAVNNIG